MKFLGASMAAGLWLVQSASAGPFTKAGVSDNQFLTGLLERRDLLSPEGRLILRERAKALRLIKRRPQSDEKNAIYASILGIFTNWNKVAPKSKVPEVTRMTSTWGDGAKKSKVRYGPYRIPPISEKTAESDLLKLKGIAANMQIATRPCSKECMLLEMSSGMEYDDGTTAENGNGAWYHHAVLMNVGINVKEPVCGKTLLENIFMVGNERTTSLFGVKGSKIKSGYHLNDSDMFVLNTEIMNMDEKEKWVWVTVTYDYIDGFNPEFKEGKMIWQSIGPNRCAELGDANPFGVTNLTKTAQPTKITFAEHSIPWTVPESGFMFGAAAHMHDGGINTKIYRNNDLLCTSLPIYSKDGKGMGGSGQTMGAGMPAGAGHSHKLKRQIQGGNYNNFELEHIASQPACIFEKPAELKKGDQLYVVANYDFTKYPG
jgi:hypothetical protein